MKCYKAIPILAKATGHNLWEAEGVNRYRIYEMGHTVPVSKGCGGLKASAT